MKETEPKTECSIYIPLRIRNKLDMWAGTLSNHDRMATRGDAATVAVDALRAAKWKPGMKLKAVK